MTRLLDVNLLMALLWENHEHHTQARSWFKGVSAFATCPVVQLGFARVSSHPLLGYGLTPELAFGVLRQFRVKLFFGRAAQLRQGLLIGAAQIRQFQRQCHRPYGAGGDSGCQGPPHRGGTSPIWVASQP